MTDLIVDNEFRDLIPPLSDDERNQLEENILRDGIQDPLKVWQGTLIDGHNRYDIAQAHELPFTTVEMQFATRDDVKIWIIKNQFGRRNLSAYDRSLLALKLKPVIAAKAKEQQIRKPADSVLQNSAEQTAIDTRQEIAKAAGVSRDDVKIWIIRNQLGRRNINKYVRSELVLQFESIIAEQSKARQLATLKQYTVPQNSGEGATERIFNNKHDGETATQLAAIADVSRDTITKVKKINQQATPEIKQALRTGDLSINAAYNKVKQAERAEDIQRQIDELEQKAIEKPDGLFDVIVIDPPWNYGTKLLAEAYRAEDIQRQSQRNS